MKVNGWTLKAHPAFSEPYQKLIAEVEELKIKDSSGYESHVSTKFLSTINYIILTLVPNDPSSENFRQGKTLGNERKHWFRAKFSKRFRLFFRYNSVQKTIIYAWVNDETTLRKAGDKTDVYQVFTKMLNKGNPPDSWDELLQVSIDLNVSETLPNS